MPIYEFYCDQCNTVFNFLARRPGIDKQPDCPQCGKPRLEKMISRFATIGRAREPGENDSLAGMDEGRLEEVLGGLMREAEGADENDPRQMARLMRRFADRAGLSLGESMEAAIARMEAGEDPERIEQEMGELMDADEPFSLETLKKRAQGNRRPPFHDERLYEL